MMFWRCFDCCICGSGIYWYLAGRGPGMLVNILHCTHHPSAHNIVIWLKIVPGLRNLALSFIFKLSVVVIVLLIV